jgi:hypothetical protein
MPEYPVYLKQRTENLPESVDQTVLNGRGLFVKKGLTYPLAEQLVASSKQPHIMRFYPDNAASRFMNTGSVYGWQRKGRLALPLVRKYGSQERLAGFGWMEPEVPASNELAILGATTSFAMRLYEGAAGPHNAFHYAKAILAAHREEYGNEGVWLETWGDDESAIATYQENGFITVDERLDTRDGEVVPRVYMTLGKLAVR